jgi:hypothetical protein
MSRIEIDLSDRNNSQACWDCSTWEAVVWVDDRALCGGCDTDALAEAAQAKFEADNDLT